MQDRGRGSSAISPHPSVRSEEVACTVLLWRHSVRGEGDQEGGKARTPPPFTYPCSGCVFCALWPPTRCGRAGETTVRSAHHQGDLEVDKGVGKQVCNPWLKLEPNMATECKYLLLIPPPPEAAGFVPAGILPAYHKPLSRHIHHLMFYPGRRNARQRCRTADGAVRQLAPIPLELPLPGGLPHLRRGESEALPPGGVGEYGGLRLRKSATDSELNALSAGSLSLVALATLQAWRAVLPSFGRARH